MIVCQRVYPWCLVMWSPFLLSKPFIWAWKWSTNQFHGIIIISLIISWESWGIPHVLDTRDTPRYHNDWSYILIILHHVISDIIRYQDPYVLACACNRLYRHSDLHEIFVTICYKHFLDGYNKNAYLCCVPVGSFWTLAITAIAAGEAFRTYGWDVALSPDGGEFLDFRGGPLFLVLNVVKGMEWLLIVLDWGIPLPSTSKFWHLNPGKEFGFAFCKGDLLVSGSSSRNSESFWEWLYVFFFKGVCEQIQENWWRHCTLMYFKLFLNIEKSTKFIKIVWWISHFKDASGSLRRQIDKITITLW
jgi:hypothetical protein